MAQVGKLPVIKRYDQLLRARRREDRRSLEEISPSPPTQNDALRLFQTVRAKEPRFRRRTFDGPLSPSQSTSAPMFPPSHITSTSIAPTSRNVSRPTSPVYLPTAYASPVILGKDRNKSKESEEKYHADELIEAARQLLLPIDSVAPPSPALQVRPGVLFARLVRCLGSFLLVLRRFRSATIVRKFLLVKGATVNRRVLSRKIKLVMAMIVRIQRLWRSAILCKRAKMKIVLQMWDAEERVLVRILVQNGERARRYVQAQRHGQGMRMEETRRRITPTDRDENTDNWCTVDLDRRWKAVEGRFRALDTHQASLAKSLHLPKKVKVQFARKYVEMARKAHLELEKDSIKEEVSRLRLRVLYTVNDAKQLLEPDEQGAEDSVDRLRMRLVLQNMTSSAALNAYKHLKDDHVREDRSAQDGHPALLLTHLRAPPATFAFYQRLRTRAQKEYIQTAVRLAHTTRWGKLQ